MTTALKKWMITFAMAGSYCMVYLDQSVVSVALPTIQKSLSASSLSIHWVVNAYLLVLATLVLSGG